MKRPYRPLAVIIVILLVIIIIFTSFYVTHNIRKIKNEASFYCLDKPFDASLITAVIKVESNFNPTAVSSKNAKGLMQLKDGTFLFVCDRYGLDYDKDDIFDPSKNIEAGVLYLDYLYKKYGDIEVALCAYNAGEGNVDGWLKDERYSKDKKTLYYIPFDETRNYVSKINFYKKVFESL